MEWCPLLQGHVFVKASYNTDGSFDVEKMGCEHNAGRKECMLYKLLSMPYVERIGDKFEPYRDGKCEK